MADQESQAPRDVGERAANALAPESGQFEDLDAAGFGEALAKVARTGFADPTMPGQVALRLMTDLARVPLVTAAAWWGQQIDPPVPVDAKDRRFADPAWSDNPFFHGVRLSYLVACRAARDVIASSGLEVETTRKASAATELMLDALAPTN